MNKIREHVLSILVLLALASCTGAPVADGQILELGAGATARGLRLALSGSPHTHLLTDGKLVFALWPQTGGFGAACINCTSPDPIGQFRYLTGGKGMWMTWHTAEDLVNWLVKEHGWTAIPASVAAQSQSILSSMAGSITGFLVVPMVIPSIPTEAQS